MVFPLFLVLLFPLGVYLLVLATINRRERPLMISGVWDALGLSFALSGVLLWVGPAILGVFYERGLLPGTGEQANRQFQHIWKLYPYVWIGYYVLVLAGQILMVLSRRDKSMVYNVDAQLLEQVVVRCLNDKGLHATPANGLVIFGHVSEGMKAEAAGAIELESFPPMRHVTLHWHIKDERLRRDLEATLGNHLDEAVTAENPATNWLMGISGLIFGIVFLGALLVILATLLPLRG